LSNFQSDDHQQEFILYAPQPEQQLVVLHQGRLQQ